MSRPALVTPPNHQSGVSPEAPSINSTIISTPIAVFWANLTLVSGRLLRALPNLCENSQMRDYPDVISFLAS